MVDIIMLSILVISFLLMIGFVNLVDKELKKIEVITNAYLDSNYYIDFLLSYICFNKSR